MAAYYNLFAAMPSLHIGWTMLIAVVFLRSTKYRWIKPFGILYPILTFFAITMTANHYIIDAVGGAAVLLAAYLLYEGFLHPKPHLPTTLAVARFHTGRAAAYLREAFPCWKGRGD